MIEHIEIEGFKSLERVSLDLGPLNIFVGTNASGKTNFLEALRVLQGIGYGYTIDEIFNGRPKIGNNQAWEGIRGGSTYSGFLRTPGAGPEGSLVQFRVRISMASIREPVHYSISIFTIDSSLHSESLAVGDRVIYNVTPFEYRAEGADELLPGESDSSDVAIDRSRPFLGQVWNSPWSTPSEFGEIVKSIRGCLGDAQVLNPLPNVQRQYSTAAAAVRMGDHGEDFAGVIDSILRDTLGLSPWLRQTNKRLCTGRW